MSHAFPALSATPANLRHTPARFPHPRRPPYQLFDLVVKTLHPLGAAFPDNLKQSLARRVVTFHEVHGVRAGSKNFEYRNPAAAPAWEPVFAKSHSAKSLRARARIDDCSRPGMPPRFAPRSWRHPGRSSWKAARCPVSAASSIISMVSRSRNSPTRITFGACRRAARRACAKFGVSLCNSR